MENLERELAEWRSTPARELSLSKVKIDPAFQPREMRLVRFRDWSKTEARSREHVDMMRRHLEANTGNTVEPILAADVDGVLYLVDGHHRIQAHKLARRRQVPARVRRMTREHAVLLSKLVNLDGVKLPMEGEQRRDAAWQYLAEVTLRGRLPLPDGESLRTMEARFGVSKDTIAAMLRKLPKVSPAEWRPEACDPGTGWPRWKYVRGSGWTDGRWTQPDEAQQVRKDAERVAKGLAKLRDKCEADAWNLGIRLYLEDAKNDEEAKTAIEAALETEGGDY